MNRWLILSLLVALLTLGATLYVCFVVPERLLPEVPTHWGIRGQPNAWVPRESAWKYLLLMPAFLFGFIGLTLVLPWLSPRAFDPNRFRPTYDFLMSMIVVLFGYLQAMILLASMQAGLDIGRCFAAGSFLFFAVVGNVIGKVRRNFWIGVRTPWTIASETVWNQTHRLAAWLWVAVGVVGFVLALAGVSLIFCFIFLMAAVLYPALHSLVLYKRLEKQGRLHDEVCSEVSEPVPH
jgi:uncharacterized membrane protein